MTLTSNISQDRVHATMSAQHKDDLVRAFIEAISTGDVDTIDTVLARSFLSYAFEGMRTRTGIQKFYTGLRASFSDLRLQVHENVGVLVEDDFVAVRTLLTGTHTGHYAGVAATGKRIDTSVSHIFRVADDRIVEHWQIMDTYRILVRLGRIPGVAAVFQQMLGVPESPEGIFQERLGTDFDAPRAGRRAIREESRAMVRRVYDDGPIGTGVASDVGDMAEDYLQNTGWTPNGRDIFGNAWAIARRTMPDGLALQTHVVAENDRVASISVWDGTADGQYIDFVSADFLRVENGVVAEHWDTVDYVRLYQGFGLLPRDL